MCVISNDIFAYIFGFFFGRTRLIKLSPKKTWEGFIGGGISTLLFSAFVRMSWLTRLLADISTIALRGVLLPAKRDQLYSLLISVLREASDLRVQILQYRWVLQHLAKQAIDALFHYLAVRQPHSSFQWVLR